MTHARELFVAVARFAAALREAGIRPGDRVAGYLPNLPETIVAALGAAAVGAVWSSCSPDFGVQGVLDRFGQIEPRVLVAADGYFYGGKRTTAATARREVAARAAVGRAHGRRAVRRDAPDASSVRAACRLWTEWLGTGTARPLRSSGCRSTIRSTSCIPPARPASRSASSTAPAAR